jgi:hypothetical protein
MKHLVILMVVAFAAAVCVTAPASAHRSSCRHNGDHGLFRGENVNVDLDHGSLVFTDEDSDGRVEITDKHALLVNGDPVRLGRHEQRLVGDYYDTFQTIIEEGKEIGIEGARIGAQGAKLGLTAILGVLKLLSDDYDQQDLQSELDHKGGKIERGAERLRQRAERLEHRAEKLKDLHEDLRNRVYELDDLGWF